MTEIRRKFSIGSEWVYLKIYTGPKATDRLLTSYLRPLAHNLLKENAIDKWFFIRYADPEHHIRFRLHVTDPSFLGTVLSQVHYIISECMETDLIWNIISETYTRELERYIPQAYDDVETYFGLESEMIIKVIDMLEGDEGEEIRWLFALRAIDSLLDDFGYDEDGKLVMLEKLKLNFAIEFNTNKQLQKQLDVKYRTHQKMIENFLSNREQNPEFAPLLKSIEMKSEAVVDCIKNMNLYLSENKRDGIIGSMIHMLMNRLFRSKNRLHEMVLYDMLYRHYRKEWGKRTFLKKSDLSLTP